jgi:RNA polymerase sigma-70 factor (ECF subfamily)
MECLPSSAREVLGLRFFGEASLDEIARILDVGLSAAKMRLYRALDQFAAIYSKTDRIDDSPREDATDARAAS